VNGIFVSLDQQRRPEFGWISNWSKWVSQSEPIEHHNKIKNKTNTAPRQKIRHYHFETTKSQEKKHERSYLYENHLFKLKKEKNYFSYPPRVILRYLTTHT
jgi:hypothetical protein